MVSTWKEKVPDWDEPSEDNDEIAARFGYGEMVIGGASMPYRLFVAQEQHVLEAKVPLVIFLHGADVTGTDNEMHLRAHDIGTMFARSDWQQEHPCYILAPQYRARYHWSEENVMNALVSLMGDLAKRYPDIDGTRIYLYGYSAGGIGGLRLMKTFPDLIRRALILCASTSGKDIEKLAATPFWLFHAPEDEFVSIGERIPGYGAGHLGSRIIYERLKATMGDDIRYTEYAAGELKERYGVNPHAVWVPVASDEAAKRWLFEAEPETDER